MRTAEEAEQRLYSIKSSMQLYEEKGVYIQKMLRSISSSISDLLATCHKNRQENNVNRNAKDEILSLRKLIISIISTLTQVTGEVCFYSILFSFKYLQ